MSIVRAVAVERGSGTTRVSSSRCNLAQKLSFGSFQINTLSRAGHVPLHTFVCGVFDR